MTTTLLHGDCRAILPTLPERGVHCCVTSPPYFGLRDYGHAGQMGLEATPDAYVAELVAVFREVRRVLRDDGTVFLNIGDSYFGGGGGGGSKGSKQQTNSGSLIPGHTRATFHQNLKPKDLLGAPWLVAFALRADGWYLRQDIIWHKPNPMPESVTDRCTKSHEYLFLLSKSPRYYFDAAAIAEPFSAPPKPPGGFNPAKAIGPMGRNGHSQWEKKRTLVASYPNETRNKRSVWTVASEPFAEAHFATFPPALIEPAILAGCPEGGTVLDPFAGAGTTGLVADRLQRNAVLIELNPAYAGMAQTRIENDAPLFAQVLV